MFPKEVQFEVSDDGNHYRPLLTVTNTPDTLEGARIRQLGKTVNTTARYIKIIAKNGGVLPAWHESAGMPTHLFIDEIIVN
jgi:hypothetical protein